MNSLSVLWQEISEKLFNKGVQLLFYDIDCTNNGSDIAQILDTHSDAYGQQEHFLLACNLSCTVEILKQVSSNVTHLRFKVVESSSKNFGRLSLSLSPGNNQTNFHLQLHPNFLSCLLRLPLQYVQTKTKMKSMHNIARPSSNDHDIHS